MKIIGRSHSLVLDLHDRSLRRILVRLYNAFCDFPDPQKTKVGFGPSAATATGLSAPRLSPTQKHSFVVHEVENLIHTDFSNRRVIRIDHDITLKRQYSRRDYQS